MKSKCTTAHLNCCLQNNAFNTDESFSYLETLPYLILHQTGITTLEIWMDGYIGV